MCVCVFVCEAGDIALHVCMCVCVRGRVCSFACVCEGGDVALHVCMCVCVCEGGDIALHVCKDTYTGKKFSRRFMWV